MSSRPGRNQPCPCGSGKKYKVCCLAKDEAAELEAAREQERFADADLFDEPELDDDEYDDFDEDIHPLEGKAITCVTYTRGFVEKLSDLRRGRGLRVTEWEVPHIPQVVLDAIEEEGLDALEGDWGDPKLRESIQVDIIDLETDDDVVSLVAFNRTVSLEESDNEEMWRIQRACETLEAADPDAPRLADGMDAASSGGIAVPTRQSSADPAEARSKLAAILKRHRQQPGVCALCGDAVSRTSLQVHLVRCAHAHEARSGPDERIVHLRATTPGLPAYWLDVEVKESAKLDALDSFLRRTWLECCDHLSVFRIGAGEYFSSGYQIESRPAFGGLRFGRSRTVERHMTVRVCDAVPSVGESFRYEYDFGSTTLLQLQVLGERTGRIGRSPVRLLARNTPIEWPCAICGLSAESVCAFCRDGGGSPFVCAKHQKQHACGEQDGFLPVVNSPRMGVCGYSG